MEDIKQKEKLAELKRWNQLGPGLTTIFAIVVGFWGIKQSDYFVVFLGCLILIANQVSTIFFDKQIRPLKGKKLYKNSSWSPQKIWKYMVLLILLSGVFGGVVGACFFFS